MGDKKRGENELKLLTESKPTVSRPSMYKVVLVNDDFTPMDFVIFVLQRFFHKTHEDSIRVMLQVHHSGAGICGVYTKDVAETKVSVVNDYARKHQHPLKCLMEEGS